MKWIRGTILLPVALACSLPSLAVGGGPAAAVSPAPNRPSPAWFNEHPQVIVGNWDSMPIFMARRRGALAPWQKEQYAREHQEETVRKLKDAGVTLAIIHFYKGFGLEAEQEHIADARILAELCHKYGIRVGVYVGSTIAFETFLLENPEAESWLAPEYQGEPVIYFNQTFRRRPYFMHPGYVEYMKKVVTIAIRDLDADLIHFDNTSLRARRPVFHHPLAKTDFRRFLEERLTLEMRKERYGFTNFRFVEPPVAEQPFSVIEDPLLQDWTDFRCHQLAEFYRVMGDYIHSLDPEVAVDNNPHSGLSGLNTAWEEGVDYPRLLRHTDAVWTEEGNPAGATEEGTVISKIRSFKQATGLDNKVFTYTSESPLQMAEAMVFNRGCLGMVGGIEAGTELSAWQRDYIRFYLDQFKWYRSVESAAEVAVLRSFSTMSFSNDRPYQETYLFEQALLQDQIPFDVIFDAGLDSLARYRVLVLADQEALNDAKLERIREFVSQGGGLVATGLTSLYDEPRIPRRRLGLADLFGFELAGKDPLADAYRGRRQSGDSVHFNPVRRELLKGRVAYLPEVRPAMPKPSGAAMTSQFWKPPVNADELLGAVRWAASPGLSMEIEAPSTVVGELLRDKARGALLIHLLNYDYARTPEVKGIKVRLLVPAGSTVKSIELLTPDQTGGPLQFSREGGAVTISVGSLRVYDLIVVTLD